MHIAAVWGLVVGVGASVGLTVSCFLFTRCCTKRRLRRKKRAPQAPPRIRRTHDSQPPLSRTSDDYMMPVSSLFPAIAMSQLTYPPMPSQKPLPPQHVQQEDNTSSREDYVCLNSGLEHLPSISTPNPTEGLPPPSPLVYDVPRPLTSSSCKTSRTPITLRTQGDKSSTFKLLPPAGSEISCSDGEMSTVNIYSTLSSMMSKNRKLGLCALEAGEGTSTRGQVQTLRLPRHDQQDQDRRVTMAEMELDNKLRVKFKVKMDE